MISLKQKAYSIIKENILQCKYHPNALLNEEMLRDELQMSRTPIRDALSRLEQEHLVQILPKIGFIVTPVSLSEAEKVYEIRMLIEPYLLENYGNRIDEQLFFDYKEMFKRGISDAPIDVIFQEDDDFHQKIIQASENHFFMQAYEYVYAQNRRLRSISGHYSSQRIERSQGEHMSIVLACIEKDWKKASDELLKHLRESKDVLHKIAEYQNIGNLY